MPEEKPKDLNVYRLEQVEASVRRNDERLDLIEKSYAVLNARMAIIGAVVLFLSPLIWKAIDKVWP